MFQPGVIPLLTVLWMAAAKRDPCGHLELWPSKGRGAHEGRRARRLSVVLAAVGAAVVEMGVAPAPAFLLLP